MTLEERQMELEAKYTSEGILRTIHQWEKDLKDGRIADTSIGRAVTLRCFNLMKTEVERLVNAGTRGVGGKYRALLKDIGVDIVTVAALRTSLQVSPVVNRVSTPSRANSKNTYSLAQDFAMWVSRTLELEYMVKKLKLAAPRYVDKVIKSLKESNTTSTSHRTRTFRKTADNVGVGSDRVLWDNSTRVGVGKLILCAAVESGIVELYDVQTKYNQKMVGVRLSSTVEESINKMVHYLKAAILFPPSLVPPVQHTVEQAFIGSSYLTPEMYSRSPSVALKYRNKTRRKWVHDNLSQEVLDGANKAANVPYVLDDEMLHTLRTAASSVGDTEVAGIPGRQPIQPPPYPLQDGWDREDERLAEIHADWRHAAKEAYSAEIERKSKLLQFNLCMKYMNEFKGDTLYFPTFLDWRGRLYFRTRINPQGADFVKACIKLKEAKPLGADGLYWLKVHVATCYGFDKAAFDTRAAWVDKNLPAIKIAVQETMDSEFFTAADSPWCFLAAAKDYLKAIQYVNPELYPSQIPVAMDATCSGLQVFSAILRDPIGGLMVNLTPNNGVEKEDIYSAVAGIAISNIQKDTENLEMAQYWKDSGVPRSMAKRPVMTYVYGGTLISCSDYVRDEMVAKGMEPLELYSLHKLANYVSRHIRKGVELAVPASAECMRFLRTAAGTMPLGEPLRWITPVGFPVYHVYDKYETRRVNLPGLGIKLTFAEFNDDETDRKRSINGIAPNFVHSLDSSHLIKVINAFQGVIVPIHDSFATHAADVTSMHKVLREQFVELHKNNDPLQQLIECVFATTGVRLTHPPKGSLNIESVRQSQFFMC